MKVLIVCSGNAGSISPFVKEQGETLEKLGVNIKYYIVKGKGISGYLKNYSFLRKEIKIFGPDLIHAHYGLSGLFTILQRKILVVITFHGCDVNDKIERFLSRIAAFFAKYVIFVESTMIAKMKFQNKNNYSVIPCGINLNDFYTENKSLVRKRLKWSSEYYHVIFSSAFNIPVKNARLAKSIISKLELPIVLHELKNLTRSEVRDYLNAGDFLLLTSIREGSPMVIKEALACNCPIVATDVGDIKQMIFRISGCFITSFDENDIERKILQVVEFINSTQRTKGRNQIEKMNLTNDVIAERIYKIYQEVLQ